MSGLPENDAGGGALEKAQEDTFQKNPRWWARDKIGATAAVTFLGFLFFGYCDSSKTPLAAFIHFCFYQGSRGPPNTSGGSGVHGTFLEFQEEANQ